MILMVDDSLDDCDLFRRHLQPAGHTIHCTRTARDALQVLQTLKPRLLVVDLFMPDVDGFGLLGQLRTRQDLRDLPILVYTVSTSPDDRDKAMALGARDFITKGKLSPDDLRARVVRLLSA